MKFISWTSTDKRKSEWNLKTEKLTSLTRHSLQKIHGAQICKDPNKTVTDKKLHEFGIRKTGLEQLFWSKHFHLQSISD